MNRNDALSDKLLDYDRTATNSDNLIEEIQSERQRQARWHRLTVICLIALGCGAVVMFGSALFVPAPGLQTSDGVSRSGGPTRPVENPSGAAVVAQDGQASTQFQFGFFDTFVVPILAVGIPFLVLAVVVSALMSWAATRSVGNAVIQKQLLELAQQVEQLQEGTKR